MIPLPSSEWIALGFCVSFVAMILPFKRGTAGVAINLGVAIAAAVAGGFAGNALGVYDRLGAGTSFAFAAGTSLAVTLIVHALFLRRTRRHIESPAE